MTKIIKSRLYCNKCQKYYDVPVVASVNSFALERDPMLKQRMKDGTLFKNFCPNCKEELVKKDHE